MTRDEDCAVIAVDLLFSWTSFLRFLWDDNFVAFFSEQKEEVNSWNNFLSFIFHCLWPECEATRKKGKQREKLGNEVRLLIEWLFFHFSRQFVQENLILNFKVFCVIFLSNLKFSSQTSDYLFTHYTHHITFHQPETKKKEATSHFCVTLDE